MGDSWATMVITPLLPMFQKPSSSAVANNNNTMSRDQTVDLAATKFNEPYGGAAFRAGRPAEVPPVLQGPYARQRQRSSTAVNNDVTNDSVYGDDDDLISSQHIGVSQVPLREAAVVVEACGTAAAVTRAVQHLWPF